MSTTGQSTARRHLRLGVVLLLVIGSTAMIGFGGLALWTAVTQNDNSRFSTSAVHHSNTATVSGGIPVACTDATSPSTCGAIFSVTNAVPGFSQRVGSVSITNTSTVPSAFQLQLKSAVTSGTGSGTTLCGSLHLTVVDSETMPMVVYSGSLAALTPQALLASSGGATWNGADSNAFQFSLSLPATSPASDQDSTCTASFVWQQASA